MLPHCRSTLLCGSLRFHVSKWKLTKCQLNLFFCVNENELRHDSAVNSTANQTRHKSALFRMLLNVRNTGQEASPVTRFEETNHFSKQLEGANRVTQRVTWPVEFNTRSGATLRLLLVRFGDTSIEAQESEVTSLVIWCNVSWKS